jgi:hypothetical protein
MQIPDDSSLTDHLSHDYTSQAAGEVVAEFRGWNGDAEHARKAEALRRLWPELHAALLSFAAHEMFRGLPGEGFDEFLGAAFGREGDD